MIESERKRQADIAPFGLRMQASLKTRIANVARENSRSMNAEIVATLEEKYPPREPLEMSFAEIFGRIRERLVKEGDPEALAEFDERHEQMQSDLRQMMTAENLEKYQNMKNRVLDTMYTSFLFDHKDDRQKR